jgi:hypothetical protein
LCVYHLPYFVILLNLTSQLDAFLPGNLSKRHYTSNWFVKAAPIYTTIAVKRQSRKSSCGDFDLPNKVSGLDRYGSAHSRRTAFILNARLVLS